MGAANAVVNIALVIAVLDNRFKLNAAVDDIATQRRTLIGSVDESVGSGAMMRDEVDLLKATVATQGAQIQGLQGDVEKLSS
eukprot:COSAG04_NODE_18776_length_433_cov_0.595808_1_plen_81_part_10